MGEWKEVKLGEFCNITSSKRIFRDEYVSEGIPFYRSKEIILKSNGNKISDLLYIKKEKYNEIKKKFGVPKKGDLLLTSVGTLGVPYVVSEKDKFYFKDGNLTWFKNFTKDLNPFFLYYYIKSPIGKATLNGLTIGSSQPALTINLLKKFTLKLPLVETQQKIATILLKYDDLIENNNKRIELLEKTAKLIYDEWFVKFKFPSHSEIEMVDSELGKIPKGWEIKKVGQELEIKRGKNLTKKKMVPGLIPVVSAGIEPSGYHNESNTESPMFSISASGANAGYVKLYYSKTWASDCSYVDSSMTNYFYFFYLLFKSRQIEITSMQKGSAQPHVYPSDLMNITFIMPNKETLLKFEEIVKNIFLEISNLKLKNKNLQETRDLLLPKLINNKIDISNLDIKVPEVEA